MSGNEHSVPSAESVKRDQVCHGNTTDTDRIWHAIHHRATQIREAEHGLRVLLEDVVLTRRDLASALTVRLARKLAREDMTREELMPLLSGILENDGQLVKAAARDLEAIVERDPACDSPLQPLLFFKGFLALATYRVAHHLWSRDRRELALYFQSIASEVFAVDIHPAARIGCGILLDHATSFVVGETAIIEDDVSILHEVTLGGTGKISGDRHPIVRTGVLLGAGAKILGRVEIGRGAKVGAGSVVLTDVPEHCTVAGVPAEIVGTSWDEEPALAMNQHLKCRRKSETS
jgi:serine O-acetyltransferase